MAARRPQPISILAASVITLALAPLGCAPNRAARVQVGQALERYRDQASQDAATFSQANWKVSGRQASTQPAPVGGAPPTEPPPSSLRDYILIALRENPDVKAAEEIARSKAARIAQVTSLPDPMLMAKILPEPVRTAEGDNPFVLGIQQKLLVPDKLQRAGDVALQDMRMALESLQATRLRVIGDVKRAYFRIYIIDETIRVDRTNQDLVRGLIDVARSQTAVGQRGQEDVLRAEVELSNLESQIIALTQERATLAARLNRLLSRPQDTPVPPVASFELRRVDATVGHLLLLAEDANPDLARLREQIERDRQSLELARLQWWPDVTLGLEWMYMQGRAAFVPPPNPQTGMPAPVNHMSQDGSDNWAITVGLNLPIWVERIRGGIEEAQRRLLASQRQAVAELDRVSYEIADALARVRAEEELAVLFRDTIIPQAQQAYEVSRAGYTAGRTSFLFMIDNWQKWLTFTIQYHRALGELERSIADLEQAVGLSLNEVKANE